ncbi:sororin [Labrus mixtus]|uniref:sororin n=1 Tax=Labrus mixtus TaxID=508554 RepID=UPI0029C019E2|nr:sororin [Labrus mixtus]
MDERELKVKMGDHNDVNCSQRRRSPRLSSPQADFSKMALVKRSITVRKIAPRKTVAPSENNKENTPRRSGSEEVQKTKPKVSTPGVIPHRRGSTSAKKTAAMPSPILSSSPPPPPPAADPVDPVWSQKVRRSYSRLSSPDSRDNMFGFERMNTPEVVKRVQRSKPGLELLSGSTSGLNSFTSLIEAEVCAPEVDTNIPGVLLVKEKKRRRKVQQIGTTEMDALAAQMNAEFEEAEVFELFVE